LSLSWFFEVLPFTPGELLGKSLPELRTDETQRDGKGSGRNCQAISGKKD
jgi:hypothetical protein